MSILTKLAESDVPKTDYASKLKAIDVNNMEDKTIQQIVNNYYTPNKNYISTNKRNLSASDVSLETLKYIIIECFQCSDKERYQASVVALRKVMQDEEKSHQINELKEELIDNFRQKPMLQQSFREFDQYQNNELFYLLEMQIGANKLLKYGITSQKPRRRFASIKKAIKEKYPKFQISIEPLLLVHCTDSKEFEEEVKCLIDEQEIKGTNYLFEGHTETVKIKHKTTMLEDIIPEAMEELEGTIVYDKITVAVTSPVPSTTNKLTFPSKNRAA